MIIVLYVLGYPHPDNKSDYKFNLCCMGIEKIWENMAPNMNHCYLWLDYACINQDRDAAGELKQLDKIVQMSDCIFTVLMNDESPSSWSWGHVLGRN